MLRHALVSASVVLLATGCKPRQAVAPGSEALADESSGRSFSCTNQYGDTTVIVVLLTSNSASATIDWGGGNVQQLGTAARPASFGGALQYTWPARTQYGQQVDLTFRSGQTNYVDYAINGQVTQQLTCRSTSGSSGSGSSGSGGTVVGSTGTSGTADPASGAPTTYICPFEYGGSLTVIYETANAVMGYLDFEGRNQELGKGARPAAFNAPAHWTWRAQNQYGNFFFLRFHRDQLALDWIVNEQVTQRITCNKTGPQVGGGPGGGVPPGYNGN